MGFMDVPDRPAYDSDYCNPDERCSMSNLDNRCCQGLVDEYFVSTPAPDLRCYFYIAFILLIIILIGAIVCRMNNRTNKHSS